MARLPLSQPVAAHSGALWGVSRLVGSSAPGCVVPRSEGLLASVIAAGAAGREVTRNNPILECPHPHPSQAACKGRVAYVGITGLRRVHVKSRLCGLCSPGYALG